MGSSRSTQLKGGVIVERKKNRVSKNCKEKCLRSSEKISIFDEEMNQKIISEQYAAKMFQKLKDQV